MGKTWHMHQYLGARLLHGLHATRGGRGFLQQGGDIVQDFALLHMVVERGNRAKLDNDVYVGGYIGGAANTEGCHCRYPVREYERAGRNLVFL